MQIKNTVPVKLIKVHTLYQALLVLATKQEKKTAIKEKVLTSKYVDIPQQTVVIETPAGV